MSGLSLMRDLALLGAACAVGTPSDQVPSAERGWTVHADRRTRLAADLAEHWADDDPLLRRARLLGLDALSYWLFALCAAVEIYPEAAAAVSIVAEDARIQLVTPTVFARLMVAVGQAAFAEALATGLEAAPLRRAGLIEAVEVMPGLPRTHTALRVTAAELGALLDPAGRLGEVRDLVMELLEPAAGSAFDPRWISGARTLLERRGALALRAQSRRAARQVAHDLATVAQQPAWMVSVGEELPALGELARLGSEGLVVLDLWAWSASRALPLGWIRQVSGLLSPLVLLVAETASTGGISTLDTGKIGPHEARAVWRMALPDAATADALAARFRVSTEEVRGALREAEDLLTVSEGADAGSPLARVELIASRVRAQGARRMGRQVTVMGGGPTLSELVLPAMHRGVLSDIVGSYRAAFRVFHEMGLNERGALGRGLTCLFSGKPGTGKTFAAQCLATELGLNLYRIDLSQVVSKYIGETEKALSGVFEEADAGHGLLLFDEADALFGKRSEVKDAHDRYANIEVGYLLQRLESYEGVAILTTNLSGNMDTAFLRRIRFALEFPMPDRGMRRRLWEAALPDRAWREPGLELDSFADRFALSGGNIRNIGLSAAHLAAAHDGGRVGNRHLARAAYLELEKTGRPSTPAAFGPLAVYLQEPA